VTWQINITETDGLIADQPALTPGESGDYSFLFRKRPEWDSLTEDHIQRFETARQAADNAGEFDSYTTITNDIYWREQDPSGPSPLVKITAADDDPTARSIWGLVESVETDTSYPVEQCTLTLSILFIADVGTDTGEFSSESDIRTAREVHGP
jgi:hypothetical protein